MGKKQSALAVKESNEEIRNIEVKKVFTTLPYNQLYLSPDNVRIRPASKEKDDELRASIAAVGIFSNLVVVKDKEEERYAVHAGGRRFQRLGELIAQGVFNNDYPTPVVIVDSDVSLDMSLMENISHEPMNQADQFVAFDRLFKSGKTISQIARDYTVSELDVKRVMKLANAAPDILDEFRNKKMSIDQLMALCLTDDHEKQKQVWFADRPDWEKGANHIRKSLMADDVTVNHKKVLFVGIEHYVESGGSITHDLFSKDGVGGYISNMPLLDELFTKKINTIADSIKGEGWGWVECAEDIDHNHVHEFQRIRKVSRELTEEEAEYKKALDLRQEQIWSDREQHEETEYPSEEDYDAAENELSARESVLDEESKAFDAKVEQWGEAQGMAGVYIYLDHQGVLSRIDGLVKREDYKRMQNDSGNGEEASKPEEKDGLSQSLKDNLMAHRTSGLQVALSESPKLALVLLVHRLMLHSFDKYRYQSHYSNVQIECSQPALHLAIPDYPLTKSATAMKDITDKWLEILPKVEDLLDWLLAQSDDVLNGLLAYCVSRSISFTHNGHNANYAKIGALLSFDMNAWWEPSAENYFKRVSKAEMKAVLDATGKTVEGDTDKMKKGELAQLVAGQVIGTGWLPELLKVN
jgi:ParB family chromosome partitioning protein